MSHIRVALDDFNNIPASDPNAAADTHTWHPINLATLDPQQAVLPAPIGLYYPGKRHLWSGEPESAKSWAALIASAHEISNDRYAMYIDFESDAHEMKERLQHLGVTDAQLANFIYLRPSDPINHPGVRDTLTLLLTMYNPALITIDAYAGALDVHELDPYKSADIERFHRSVVEPLRQKGAATIILDHVVKNKENRGKFSIGSERKVGSVDVHLQFETITPFARGRTGRFTVKVPKDRPGWLNRPIGTLELTSDPDTHAVTWQLKHEDSGGDHRPTTLMERVSDYLEGQPLAVTLVTLENTVNGKRAYIRKAVDVLIQEGYVHQEIGSRNSRLLTSIHPYKQHLDPDLAPRPDLAPTSPGARSHTSLAHLAPPPLTGGTRGEVVGEDGEDKNPRPRPDLYDQDIYDQDIPF